MTFDVMSFDINSATQNEKLTTTAWEQLSINWINAVAITETRSKSSIIWIVIVVETGSTRSEIVIWLIARP